MTRWRDRFAEPIDFAALAIERSRKGWRPTPKQKAKLAAKRKAEQKARVRAAAKRIEATRPKRQTISGATERLLATFQPGSWYGLGDLINASGLKRGTVHGLVYKLTDQGKLRRTKNPAFERQGFMEPEWLYQLVEQMVRDVDEQEHSGADPE